MVDIEISGAHELIASLDKAQRGVAREAEAVVAKGSLNIKKDAAQRITGLAHAPAYPASIGYDLFHTPGTVSSRIGPDKSRRQGALGNILEYGTRKNAPIPHLAPALDAEEPRYVKALEQLGPKLLED